MANDREVKYRLTGDVSELQAALNSAESDFEDLGKVGKSITVLENAVASVRAFETEVAVADAKVRQLKAALSEAYAADADAPQIRKLERDLGSAEKAAVRAETALGRANAEVVRLNLEAGKTGVSTGNLAAKNQELAAETEKVRAKMAALGQQVKETAAAEEQAAARAGKLNSAFATLNIKPAAQINAEILRINQSLDTLARSATVSGAEFERAYAAAQSQIARLRAEVSGSSDSMEKSGGIVSKITGLFGGLRGILATIGIGAVGDQFLQANLQAEKFERALTAINGSSKAAASDLKFLHETANRLGLDFESVAGGFTKFAAASKGTSLEGQKTRDIFVSVAGAMSKLGLSTAEQERAFTALGQMMSKGTVNAEELKGQLGDVLPGAFQIAARAVGVTTAELGKLMEQGGVIADQFLPRFAVELQRSFGDTTAVEGLSATIARLKNTWSEAMTVIGSSGLVDLIAGPVKVATALLLGLGNVVNIVVVAFTSFVKALGVVAGAVATLDFSNVSQSMKDIGTQAVDQVEKFARLTNSAIGLSDATAGVGSASSKAAGSVADAARAAAEAGPSFEKLQVIYADLEKKTAAASETAVKNAEARKAEGEAAVAAANAFGTEKEKRDAAVASTKATADAMAEVAKNRQIEYGMMQSHLAAVQAEIAATGQETEAQAKLVAELKNKTAERLAAAEKATAEANSTRLAADAAAVASQAYADNSARLEELRAAAEKATAAVETLREAKARGVDVTAQLTEAERTAGMAMALYRDAISDTLEKINAMNAAKQGEINVASAGIKLAIEQQRSILEVARARGDERSVMLATLEIKKLEIKLAELTAKAKKAEAEAALLAVKAKREELQASGQLTPAKEAELKAQEAAAEVKKIEGQIASETAARMKELADITAQSSNAATQAAGKYDQLAKSLDGVANSAGAAGDAMSNVGSAPSGTGGESAGGAANSREERVGTVSSDQFFFSKIMEQDLPLAIAEAAYAKVNAIYAQEKAQALKGKIMSTEDYIGRMQYAEKAAVERAVIEAQAEARAAADKNATPASQQTQPAVQTTGFQIGQQAAPQAGAATAQQAARTTKVEINLGGKKSTVGVASQQDANVLTDIFRRIETDAARAF